MRTTLSTFITALFLTTAFTALADDAVKTSQPPYKPGRQLDDGNSGAPAAAERSADEDQSVKSARPPYKPGRQADEQDDKSEADTASKK